MRLQVGKTDEAALGKWVAFSFYEAEKEKEKKKENVVFSYCIRCRSMKRTNQNNWTLVERTCSILFIFENENL